MFEWGRKKLAGIITYAIMGMCLVSGAYLGWVVTITTGEGGLGVVLGALTTMFLFWCWLAERGEHP